MGAAAKAFDVYRTSSIRDMTGPEILDSRSGLTDFTRQRFSEALLREGGVRPLFIPCKDEADDLPGTLLAAARTDAFPVVLDNNSSDSTGEIGRDMGALVVNVRGGSKMAATQTAVAIAQGVFGVQDAFFTDGDTLVVPSWTDGMSRRLEEANKGYGVAVFANSLFWHGKSRTTDLVMSGVKTFRAVKAVRAGQELPPRGHNYALRLDEDGQMAAAIDRLDPDIFTWDDLAIHDVIKHESQARIVGAASLDTVVITRNDRNPSLLERISSESYRKNRVAAYETEYGPHVIYRRPDAWTDEPSAA